MSHADELLFQDVKAALLREITAVNGQNNLDEAFVAWLLCMHDGELTVEVPAWAAGEYYDHTYHGAAKRSLLGLAPITGGVCARDVPGGRYPLV